MNRSEAYSHLGANDNTTPEELKSKFRKLAKQYHPDNKDTGNELKFKQINEAYTRLSNNDFPDEQRSFNPFDHLDDMFGTIFSSNFTSPFRTNARHVQVTINVPYEISVKGGKASFSVVRNKKCGSCNGNGGTYVNAPCSTCKGTGVQQTRVGHVIMNHTCSACAGKQAQMNKCSACNGSTVNSETVTLRLELPPGIATGNTLRIPGAGNWCGVNQNGVDMATDVHVVANVMTHEKFVTKGNDVHSTVKIGLLDALRGCALNVDTVYGDAQSKVPAKTKNGDSIKISNHGVGGAGNHVVTLLVDYPEDVSELIKVLT
jgi:molecular chaperone DnaJ